MDWSQRRKIVYATIFAAIVVAVVAYPVYKLTSKAPTCFDSKKNSTEVGVDCGGSCALMCANDVKDPRIVWVKAFPLINGRYDVAAYVENLNNNAGIMSAHYTIRVYGSDDSVLAERGGATEIAPGSRVLIFETDVAFSGEPDRTEIIFDKADLGMWTRATTASSPVVTKNQSLIGTDTSPRFDAVLVNTDPVNEVSSITLGAIIYDTSRNPVAVSKTYVDSISKGGEQNIFFTWPKRFTKFPRGAKCTMSGELFMNTASSTVSVEPTIPCSVENFVTEIVITPKAIFQNNQ